MATIYFGSIYPATSLTGNWNSQDQWYSDLGEDLGKSGITPGTLLGRLPTMADVCIISQTVTTGVVARALTLTTGASTSWTGQINGFVGALNDPTATWSGSSVAVSNLNISSGTVNFSFTRAYQISGGVINGNMTLCVDTFISGGTFNGIVSGQIRVSNNPTFNGNLTLIRLTLISGTFTKPITSWATGNQGLLRIEGGAYNSPSSPTSNLSVFTMIGGTMAQNIFTSAYTALNSVSINGGTLGFTGNMQVGAPGRACVFGINSNYSDTPFAGTDNNMTIYANPASDIGTQWGSSTFVFPLGTVITTAGTYTGLITILPSTGTKPVKNLIFGGTYTPPVQTLPLSTVAYGTTGRGLSVSSISALYQNWGFANYTSRIAITGSSDILQSELP